MATLLLSMSAATGATAAAPQSADLMPGAATFRTFCVGCHGADATGCGTSARLYRPRPANLTASNLASSAKFRMIRNGGEANGRSPFMPPWVGAIDDGQIELVITYIESLPRRQDAKC